MFIMVFIFFSSFKLEHSYNNLINYFFYDLKIDIKSKKKPINYLISNLDFLISDYLFIEDKSLIIKNNYPKVYIYSTHDKENYKENNSYSIKPNVITASLMLKDNLAKYNILSHVEEKKVSNYLDNKPYSDSYKISRNFLENAILLNNNYEYFLDIHRDSVGSVHTQINLNDKEYARIMFVLGLENDNYQENLLLMEKLNNYLDSHYPGVSRGIYKKSGSNVNGVYNQDFHPNTILIEIGGIDSNLESVYNSTEIIAEALYSIIGD